MSTFKRFEDIEAWKKARVLSQQIYSVTRHPEFINNQDLRWQINKSAGSIMDNIAEGFERGGRKEFLQFLSISKGSAGELRSQLYRAKDLELIDNNQLKVLFNLAEEVGKMLVGLMSYLRKSDIKGPKYKL